MPNHIFNVGDKVSMVHKEYNNIPQGSIGEVTFVGMMHRGVRSYHVKFPNVETAFSAFELSPAKDDDQSFLADLISDLDADALRSLMNYLALSAPASTAVRATIKGWRKRKGI